MVKIKTLDTVNTKYPADSIEWCPHPEYSSFFVCGTYQFESNKADSSSSQCHRKGRIYLYEFDINLKSLKEHHFVETAGILDLKWLKFCTNFPTLAAANALGQIEIFEMESNMLHSRVVIDLNPGCRNLLTLSLDWECVQTQGIDNTFRLIASDSIGDVSLIGYRVNGRLEKLHTWSAHNFEAWICAFDKWQQNVIYTGGDDTFMFAYDLRTYTRIFTNKSHDAGVTSVLSHPRKEYTLLTGSYDEHLRVFDTRSLSKPLGDVNLKGGIWRLKSDPVDQNLILAACMYENFSVIKLFDNGTLSTVGVYDEHKSICYGADWCLKTHPDSKELYIATCSFYDQKICLSSVAENININ